MKCLVTIILVLLSLSPTLCIAQQNFEYVGFIKLNDSSLISLSLNLEEHKGKIKGFTHTDVGGEHETKTSIVGTYNHDKKILKFQEVETIYTKSYVSENDFCYINFTSKSYKLGKTSKLKGTFKGLFSDKTVCINGEISLSTKEKQLKKIEKVQKFIKKTKRISDNEKENIDLIKIMDTVQMNVLKQKQVMSVFAKNKDIRIEIYDGGQIDGDKITLTYNNKTILRNFETKKERKIIPIILSNKKNIFILTADNVGSMSSNTAVIEIFVDGSKIRALTNLKASESTQIDFYLK